jgi:DNA-directed RNA polymerase specialized sigma subunit
MENINLLRKIAMSFSQTTGLEFDDLFQEASLAYMNAKKTHDPEKSKITTHLWVTIHNHLKNYIMEEEIQKCKKYGGGLFSIEKTTINISINHQPYWESLNKEAQEITKVIFNSSKDFIGLPPDEAQIKIVQLLLNKGWGWIKIMIGMKNLRETYA